MHASPYFSSQVSSVLFTCERVFSYFFHFIRSVVVLRSSHAPLLVCHYCLLKLTHSLPLDMHASPYILVHKSVLYYFSMHLCWCVINSKAYSVINITVGHASPYPIYQYYQAILYSYHCLVFLILYSLTITVLIYS